jgi:hypothetical protein
MKIVYPDGAHIDYLDDQLDPNGSFDSPHLKLTLIDGRLDGYVEERATYYGVSRLTRYHYREGVLHHDHHPAIESSYGSIWAHNGKHHRLDGPAVIVRDQEPHHKYLWQIHGHFIYIMVG